MDKKWDKKIQSIKYSYGCNWLCNVDLFRKSISSLAGRRESNYWLLSFIVGLFIFCSDDVCWKICLFFKWNKCIKNTIFRKYHKPTNIHSSSYYINKILQNGSLCSFYRFYHSQ